MKNGLMPTGPFHLQRFVDAQTSTYQQALSELHAGQKWSHWIWFIFPQLDGLGRSDTARFYAIKSIGEARAYMEHPVLGMRLLECTEAMLAIEEKPAAEILGFPDDLKFRSSMTLFNAVCPETAAFNRAIEQFFNGELDLRTFELLRKLRS